MKRKNFKSRVAVLVVFLLVGVLGITTAAASLGGNTSVSGNPSNISAIQSTSVDKDVVSSLDPNKVEKLGASLTASDKVGYIIEMDSTSLIDTYLASPGGYESFADYLRSTEGKNAAENLKNKQKAMFNKIARQVDAKMLYNYTNVMNGFSIEISFGDRKKVEKIAYKAGAELAYISEQYETPQIEAVENQVVAQDTGIFDSSASIKDGLGGAGTVVAILDTGLDWEHNAFSPKDKNFAVEGYQSHLKLKEEDIKKLVEEKFLAAEFLFPGVKENSLYINEKVPYAFDYADLDAQVNVVEDNDHGTHVAGIIAGHSDTPYKGTDGKTYLNEVEYNDNGTVKTSKYYTIGKDGTHTYQENQSVISDTTRTPIYDKTGKQITGIRGVAPQAQLAIFKVFSDYDSGAHDYSILAALNDAILLDVDVINMSLGADCGFQEESQSEIDGGRNEDDVNFGEYEYEEEKVYKNKYEVYERVGKAGISLVVAGSNAYSSNYNSHAGLNLTSNPDSGTVGSPAAYDASFAVASIAGVKSKYIRSTSMDGNTEFGAAYYNESAHTNGDDYDFMNDLYTKIDRIVYASLTETQKNAIPEDQRYDDITSTEQLIANSASRVATLKGYITKDASENKHALGHSEDFILSIPYVTIYGIGSSSNYAGKNVTDKIALVSRGENTFEEKLQTAESQGALACVVYNNAAGVIRMSIGDNIHIPSCSITMDDAVNIRNVDNGGTSAMFVIDPSKEAGPFMSEFSSWGPLPNLTLKPEITAHGGEIYSAIPGDETAYTRLSGTSMACPNMAGVVALLRQYMQQEATIAKFDLDKNNSKKIDTVEEKNLMEQRIYQLLMSTATIAHNQEDNPYSPRKQGAGLADLEKSRASEQYLYVLGKDGKEKERTKIELYDDPDRTGVYNAVFYIRNVGSTQEYTIGEYVMTEGISTDGKTVNEKSHVFKRGSDYTVSLDAYNVKNNNTITTNVNDKISVSKGNDIRITLTITLRDSAKKWLSNFENGMYVEGFVCLKNVTAEATGVKKGCDLNIPYLAFYGDWADAPIMDYDIYETTADENNDNIDDEDKRYSNARPIMLLGKFSENGSDYIIGLGDAVFTIPEEFNDVDATADKCAISFNMENGVSSLYGVSGFLRGAKRCYYRITDVETGEILVDDVHYNVKKATSSGNSGGAYIDLKIDELGVVNNHQYKFEIYPVLDWEGFEDFTSINYIERYYQDYNDKHPDNPKKYKWETTFWVDSDAPFISDAEVRVVKDSENNPVGYYLDLYITDNHYSEVMSFQYYDIDQKEFVTAFSEEGMRPINSTRNSTTTVTYNITSLWDQIQDCIDYRIKNKDNSEALEDLTKSVYPGQFRTVIYDYAFNRAAYTINIFDLMPDIESIAIGDIGNYSQYTSSTSDETISVLTSYNKEVEIKENGSFTKLTALNIVPKQKFDLKKAVVTKPLGGWFENIEFSTSNDKIVKVDNESGELYGVSAGTATITAAVRTNKQIKYEFKVTVLSDTQIKDFNINASRLEASQNFGGLSFKDFGKSFNAGEEYVAEVESDPWYYNIDFGTDNGQYFINYSSSSEIVATVKASEQGEGYDPFKVTIKANDSYYDEKSSKSSSFSEKGEYKENNDQNATITALLCQYDENGNKTIKIKDKDGKEVERKYSETYYSATFTVVVMKEFVVEGGTLTEYHGTPKVGEGGLKWVKIPNNIDITSIGSSVFFRRDDIEAIEFNEGIETIGYASCAYMKKLRKIVLPSTLKKIDSYAFAAYITSSMDGPVTRLSEIDTSRCVKPLHVANNAVAMQYYIGVDIVKSGIDKWKDDADQDKWGAPWNYTATNGTSTTNDKGKGIVLLPKDKDKDGNELDTRGHFDTSMIRVVGDYAFYGLIYLPEMDLSGLRSCGVASFFRLGMALPLTFGDKTLAKEEKEKENNSGVTSNIADEKKDYKDKDTKGNPIYAKVTLSEYVGMKEAAFAMGAIGEITLPMSRIGHQAFFGSVDYKDDDDEEGTDYFNYLGELHKITFTGKNIVIESAAFAYSSVEEVVFDSNSSVEFIDDMAFYNSKVKNVTFKNDVTVNKMGTNAFAECDEMEEFTLPKGLTEMGNGVFYGCDKLKTVNIAKGCAIKPEAFGNDIVDSMEGAMFSECDAFANFYIVDNNEGKHETNGNTVQQDEDHNLMTSNGILYADGGETLIAVPNAHNFTDSTAAGQGAQVQAADGADEGRTKTYTKTDLSGILKVNSKDVKKINRFAFAGTKISGEIDLSNVEKIGDGAFFLCDKLEKVKLKADIKEIPDACFYGCTKLEEVNFNDLSKIERIGKFAFFNCKALKNVNLKGTVQTNEATIKQIDVAAFFGCKALTEFKFPRSITKVEANTFTNCTALKTVFFNNVTDIQDYAFVNSGIEKVDSSKVTYVGHYSFAGCALLTEIKLTAAQYLGQCSFAALKIDTGEEDTDNEDAESKQDEGETPSTGDDTEDPIIHDTKLKTVTFSNNIKVIDAYAFAYQKNIDKIDLSNVQQIGYYAFTGCEKLTTVDLSSVVYILDYAFADSGVKSITGYDASGKKVTREGYGIIPADLKYMSPTALSRTNIKYFYKIAKTNTSDYFTDDYGIVYRILPTGGYELVSFPTASPYPVYSIIDKTVRIAVSAFGYSTNLMRVDIPSTVTSIGDGAFINSNIIVYNFRSLNAPELETGTFSTTIDNYDYYWQCYANFRAPFNYNNDVFSTTYKYNSIRPLSFEDDILNFDENDGASGNIHEENDISENTSIVGGGFEDVYLGIIISRPSNGIGYDSYVYANYFDSEMLTAEALEPGTENVMQTLRELPEASQVTEAHRDAIELARGSYDSIQSEQQKAFIIAEGLVDRLVACEDALAKIDADNNTNAGAVLSLIRALPDPSKVTLNDEEAIVNARAEYNKLSSGAKAIVDADTLAIERLTKCEERIKALKEGGGKGCGSVGTGLLIGLPIALVVIIAACLCVIFFTKRKKASVASESAATKAPEETDEQSEENSDNSSEDNSVEASDESSEDK